MMLMFTFDPHAQRKFGLPGLLFYFQVRFAAFKKIGSHLDKFPFWG